MTAHPFCTTLGPHDCRITTRYDERFFNAAFFGILHEAGHGMYEQGLPPEHFGLPLGEAVSLGIHESQSRLWENMVGRSRAFWEHFYPAARQRFPAALGDVAGRLLLRHQRRRPSLIRVEADEATYNLHILIRFELEQALLAASCPRPTAPAAWNEKYRQYLGITPPNDATACCKTFTGAPGLVGYFPTYSLGNLYAAQFFAAADRNWAACKPVRPGRVPAPPGLAAGANPLPRPTVYGGRTGSGSRARSYPPRCCWGIYMRSTASCMAVTKPRCGLVHASSRGPFYGVHISLRGWSYIARGEE